MNYRFIRYYSESVSSDKHSELCSALRRCLLFELNGGFDLQTVIWNCRQIEALDACRSKFLWQAISDHILSWEFDSGMDEETWLRKGYSIVAWFAGWKAFIVGFDSHQKIMGSLDVWVAHMMQKHAYESAQHRERVGMSWHMFSWVLFKEMSFGLQGIGFDRFGIRKIVYIGAVWD